MARDLRIFVVFCTAVFLAVGYTLMVDTQRIGMLFIGDLPGFYGLGRIVLEGRGSELYDFDLQREIQNAYWPVLAGTFFPTMYPPFFAALLALVAWIPPRLLQVILCVGGVLTVLWVRRSLMTDRRFLRLTLILFSLPVFVSLAGAQSTALTIFILLLARELRSRGLFLWAGIVAAALLYKPQVGVVLCGVMGCAFGGRFCIGVALGIAVQYILGCLTYGGEWLGPWVHRLVEFSALRGQLDGPKMTSVVSRLPLDGVLGISIGTWSLGIAVSLCAAFALTALVRARRGHDGEAIVDTLLVLFPSFMPQVMFYDLGVAVVWAFSRAPFKTRTQEALGYCAFGLVNLACFFRDPAFSLVPLGAIVVAAFDLWGQRCARS